jgi:hypothetical protein
MASALDAHISRQDAARAARVDPQVISMWAYAGWVDPETGERRKLEVVKRDWRKRPFYRYGDVLEAEKATRNSAKGRPRKARPAPAAWADLDLNSNGIRYAS